MAKVTIDGIEVEVPNGSSVIQAAELAAVSKFLAFAITNGFR